jgi:hypothetical protein
VTDVAIDTWPDPSVLLDALGVAIVERRAREGDRAAQYSQGCRLLVEAGLPGAGAGAGPGAGLSGAGGRSPTAEVGLSHRCTIRSSLTTPSCVDGHLTTK